MTLQEKKVSLTIETDWLTFDYVDRLSKTIETIHQSLEGIQAQTAVRFEELRQWSLEDPTEWLEDIEDELKELREKINEQQAATVEQTAQLQTQQQEVVTKVEGLLSTYDQRVAQQLTAQKQAVATVEGDFAKRLEVIEQSTVEGMNQLNEQNELLKTINNQLTQGFDQIHQVSQLASDNKKMLEKLEQKQQNLEDRLEKVDKNQSDLSLEVLKIEGRLNEKIDDAKNEIINALLNQLKQEQQPAPTNKGGNDDGEN